jgi:hypothetical protein
MVILIRYNNNNVFNLKVIGYTRKDTQSKMIEIGDLEYKKNQ